MRSRFRLSAGGVVFRREGDEGPEVALISVGGRWALPKGQVEKGESPEAAALREVREETGLEAEIVARLTPIEYWYWWEEKGERVRYHKKVYFFLMAWRGGDFSRHDAEVDSAAWFPIDEAIRRASYPREQAVLREAKAVLETGPSLPTP